MNINEIRKFRDTLRKLERNMDAQLKEGVNCCGVTMVQCHTLLELSKYESVNLKDLAAALQLDKSTVSRAIDLLVKQALVIRETDLENRRAVLIGLTNKGKEVCTNINAMCDEYYLEVFNRIPQEKHNEVMNGLYYFSEALSKMTIKKQAACSCSSDCSSDQEKERDND